MEALRLAIHRDLDHRLAALALHHPVRKGCRVALDRGVVELPADEPLGVVDGVFGVSRSLGFRPVADEPLRLGEGDVGRRGAVALGGGDDLDPVAFGTNRVTRGSQGREGRAAFPDADTAVGRPEIDPDRR